jgi:D-amino-acid dehydrogenase
VATPQIAVIGGGIAGASTAFALAVAGAEVVVVDGGFPGQATAAGAGIIAPWSSNSDGPIYDLYAAGTSYYPTLIERLGAVGIADVAYHVAGALVVHADPARLDDVERELRRRTAGVTVAGSVERLDARQARTLFPPLSADLHAVLVSGGARVDGRRLRSGLLAAAQRLGAVVVNATARLSATAAGSWQVHTSNGTIGADVVVVACGAWANNVVEPLGYHLAVEPQRGQLAHLLLDGVDTDDWPALLPLSASHYLVPFDAGRIVVGATRETGSGFDPRVTAGGMCEVLVNALSVAPGLAAAPVIETRVGLRPLAPRQLPFLGPVDGLANLFVNAGFGAAGLTMAPVVGEALAQLIVTGSCDLDLNAFVPPPLGR